MLRVAGLAWCAILAVGRTVMRHEMAEIADAVLAAEARTVAALVAGAGAAPAGLGGDHGPRLRITLPGAPPPDAPWPPPAADGRQRIGDWTVVRVTAPGGAVVEVGEDGERRRDDYREAAWVWLLATVPLLGLLLLVIVWSVRGVLAPVTHFAAAMDARPAADPSPVPSAGLPSELQPIPRALDRYLARIEALVRAERATSRPTPPSSSARRSPSPRLRRS